MKNKYKTLLKKSISILIIITFVFQIELFQFSQEDDEINRQFHKAVDRYLNGQLVDAKSRLDRIIAIIAEKELIRDEILGQCYLLMAAINEQEEKPDLAEENYKKAKDGFGITAVAGVDLEPLPLYRQFIKGEKPKTGGQISIEGKSPAKKKFPWFLVAGGAVVLTILAALVFKKKAQYDLTVTRTPGINGSPDAGTFPYKKGSKISYQYSLQEGYANLVVRLDGVSVPTQGTVLIDSNHTLAVSTESILFETDKDDIRITEGQSTTLGIKLSGKPTGNVNATVARYSGDEDINVVSGSDLLFAPENWNVYQYVTLFANPDPDAEDGNAVIRISAPAYTSKDIPAQEIDIDVLRFITDQDHLEKITIPEGNTAVIQTRLSAMPASTVNASVTLVNGDTDISITSGSTLTFTSSNWNTPQPIAVRAAEDPDIDSGTATLRIAAPGLSDKDIVLQEGENDVLQFLTNLDEIRVPESETVSFQVKLSALPHSDVTATIIKVSGDNDIQIVSGSTLFFNSTNYNIYQAVSVQAMKDGDAEEGSATIRISGTGLPDKTINAKEIEKDILQFITNGNKLEIEEEKETTLLIRLSALPTSQVTVHVTKLNGDPNITVPDDVTLIFTPANYNVSQPVTIAAAKDEDIDAGSATLLIKAESSPPAPKEIIVTEVDNGPGLPPNVTIKSPKNGDTVYDDVTIQAVADDDFGVKMVEFYIDSILAFTDKNSPYTYTWSTRLIPDGPHQIKVVASDMVLQKDENEITVSVADSLPTAYFDQLPSLPLNGIVKITVNASDYRAVQSIQVYIDNVPLTSWSEGPQRNVSFTFDFNTLGFTNGTHVMKAVAIDSAGQPSEPAEVSIIIQN